MLARLLHPLLQEHCITIFRLSPEAKAQVREAFLAALRVRLAGSAAEARLEEVAQQTEQPEFGHFLDALNKLCLHIELNEPPLRFEPLAVSALPLAQAAEASFAYEVFHKARHFCIDGFPREDSVCLVVQDPPRLPSGHAFQGLKASVLVLEPDALTPAIHAALRSPAEGASLPPPETETETETEPPADAPDEAPEKCSTPELEALLGNCDSTDSTPPDRPETPCPARSKMDKEPSPSRSPSPSPTPSPPHLETSSPERALPSKITIESPSPRRRAKLSSVEFQAAP